MAKINQIQDRMRELGPGEFQKLVEDYLQARGLGTVHAIGSVAGQSKTRPGTPDALVLLESGKYLVVESTTQQEGVEAKFLMDLDKCFDEIRTGIPLSTIDRVLLFANFEFGAPTIELFRRKTTSSGLPIDLLDLSSLAYALKDKFPGLALEHLQVPIDTNQVLPLETFVTTYDANKLATPLGTAFLFRTTELEAIISGWQESDLVLLSGGAGVGKSRLALEACRKYQSNHPEFAVFGIFSRGLEIFDDLRSTFSRAGSYLILVDDANRHPGFRHVVDLIAEARPDQAFKVVATVRDYGLQVVRKNSSRLTSVPEISLAPFESEQIKALAREEFGILNSAFLDRIVYLAKGNPRLAVMVCKQAVAQKDMQGINNVEALYDTYYSSIREDLISIGDHDLVAVAGIVSLFRVIDKENQELLNQILAATNLGEASFWKSVDQLHSMEVFDLYEKQVVKVADQILATYLSYLVFFRDKLFDLQSLFIAFFPQYPQRMLEMVNPIFSSFYSQRVKDQVVALLESAFQKFQDDDRPEVLFRLVEQYGTLIPNKTLLHVRDMIRDSFADSDVEVIKKLSPAPTLAPNSILSILASFHHAEPDHQDSALQLVWLYLEKHPQEIPQVLYLVTKVWGFDKYTHRYNNYEWQQKVLDSLWQGCESPDNRVLRRLWIGVAEQFLQTHVTTTESGSKRTINILDFNLVPSEELRIFRQTLWERLLLLQALEEHRAEVDQLLQRYEELTQRGDTDQITNWDAQIILQHARKKTPSQSLSSRFAMLRCLEQIERENVSVPEEVRLSLKTIEDDVYNLMVMDRRRFWEDGYNHTTEVDRQRERIKNTYQDLDLPEYFRLVDAVQRLVGLLADESEQSQIFVGLLSALTGLENRDTTVLQSVLDYVIKCGLAREMTHTPVFAMLQVLGTDGTYQFIMDRDFEDKYQWLLSFFQGLEDIQMSDRYIAGLHEIFRLGKLRWASGGLDFLLRFAQFDSNLIPHLFSSVLERSDDSDAGFLLRLLLSPWTHEWDYKTIFSRHPKILEMAYLRVDTIDRHLDYDGRIFGQILDLDSTFVTTYLDAVLAASESSRPGNGSGRDYSFLWVRPDSRASLETFITEFATSQRSRFLVTYRIVETLFKAPGDHEHQDAVKAIQDEVLTRIIGTLVDNADAMNCIFEILAEFEPARRIPFVKVTLQAGVSAEVFRRLAFIPSHMSWSGSAVPVHQARIEYLQSIPMAEGVAFLEHRQHVEDEIRDERRKMERAQKWEFMEED